MSTTRLSFGAVLGTVQSAATTVTTTLDTVAVAVGMATTFVTQAADNQRLRQIADKEDFVENLIMEKAEQRAISHLKAEKFVAKSSDHNRLYSAAYTKFTKLLRDPKELEQDEDAA